MLVLVFVLLHGLLEGLGVLDELARDGRGRNGGFVGAGILDGRDEARGVVPNQLHLRVQVGGGQRIPVAGTLLGSPPVAKVRRLRPGGGVGRGVGRSEEEEEAACQEEDTASNSIITALGAHYFL